MRPHEKSIPPPQPAVLIALGTWPLTAAPRPAHLQQRRRHGRAGSARGQRRQQRKPLHGQGLGRRGVGAAVAAGQRLQRGRGRRQRGQQRGRGGALLPQRGRSRRRQVAALGRVPRAPCAARSLLARVPRALRGLRGRGRAVCGRAAAVPSPQRTVRMQSQPCLTLYQRRPRQRAPWSRAGRTGRAGRGRGRRKQGQAQDAQRGRRQAPALRAVRKAPGGQPWQHLRQHHRHMRLRGAARAGQACAPARVRGPASPHSIRRSGGAGAVPRRAVQVIATAARRRLAGRKHRTGPAPRAPCLPLHHCLPCLTERSAPAGSGRRRSREGGCWRGAGALTAASAEPASSSAAARRRKPAVAG